MGKGKDIMVGVADVTEAGFFPYYATVHRRGRSVEQIAVEMAGACFKSKKFVYASVPPKTKWSLADQTMKPLWAKHKS